ncbi:hypothetical protein KM043_006369 [Ampulex compressa]|nr:hypothetical protein KM043_006369 [Ampulex compressa]
MIALVPICLILVRILPIPRGVSCQRIDGSLTVLGNDTLLLIVPDAGSNISDESLDAFLRAVRGVKDVRLLVEPASSNATRSVDLGSFSPGKNESYARSINEDDRATISGKVVALITGKESNWFLDWISRRGYVADVLACGRLFTSNIWLDIVHFLFEYLTSMLHEKIHVGNDPANIGGNILDKERSEVLDRVSEKLRQTVSLLSGQTEAGRKDVDRLFNKEYLDLRVPDIPKNRRMFRKLNDIRRLIPTGLDLKDVLKSEAPLDRPKRLRSNDMDLYLTSMKLLEYAVEMLLRWIADKRALIEEDQIRRSSSVEDRTRRFLAIHDRATDLRRMIRQKDESLEENLDVGTYDEIRAKVLSKILDGILSALSAKGQQRENRVDEDKENIAKHAELDFATPPGNDKDSASERIDLKDEEAMGKNHKANELRLTRRTLTRIGESMHDTNGNRGKDWTMIWTDRGKEDKFHPDTSSLGQSSNSASDSKTFHRHRSGRKSSTRFERPKNTSDGIISTLRFADDDVWRSNPKNISKNIASGSSRIHSVYDDDLWIIPNSSASRNNGIPATKNVTVKDVSRDIKSKNARGVLNVFTKEDVSGKRTTKVIGSSAWKFGNKEKHDLREERPQIGGIDVESSEGGEKRRGVPSVMDEIIAAVSDVLPAQKTRRFSDTRPITFS